MRLRRGSCSSIHISIVRKLCQRPRSRSRYRGLGLSLLLRLRRARADEPPCPEPTVVSDAHAPAKSAAPAANPADQPITIESDDNNFEFDVDGNARLCGNVEMRQGDRHIRADCLEYNAGDQSAKLTGGIEYTDPLLVVRGNAGTYSPALGADFQGTQFELPERGARGAARNLRADANGKVTLEGVNFTTCPPEQVDWQIEAKQIELDTRAGIGTGRGTKVEFKGVPILYAPWFTFPIGPQRKSGFLFPNVGALVAQWRGIRGALLLEHPAESRFHGRAGLLLQARRGPGRRIALPDAAPARQRSSSTIYPDDDVANRDRSRVTLNHVAELPGEWRLRIDATDVSDTNYFEDFARGPEGTSVPFAERLAEITYRDEHFNVRGADSGFPDHRRRTRPRGPPLLARTAAAGLGRLGQGPRQHRLRLRRGNGELRPQHRCHRLASRRGTARRLRLVGAGVLRAPLGGLSLHAVLAREPGGRAPTIRRRARCRIATLDAGLVFERSSGSHGQRRLTLEPRALYLYTPFREQGQLPLFDTGLPDLNLVQLYRTNRYVGADRVNDANQVAVGLTSRLLDSSSGAQYLSVSVGQAYYFEKPRVVLPDRAAGDARHLRLHRAGFADGIQELESGSRLSVESRGRHAASGSQFRLQYRPGGERVVNLAYRALRDRIEQVDASVAWPISNRWNVYGRYVYSLLDSKTLDQFAGFRIQGLLLQAARHRAPLRVEPQRQQRDRVPDIRWN